MKPKDIRNSVHTRRLPSLPPNFHISCLSHTHTSIFGIAFALIARIHATFECS
jgi:hypothetical protein